MYIGVDGSMLLTRNGGWREAKLMRIFSEQSYMDLPEKQSYLKDSQYIGHLGNSHEFCQKAEDLIDSYKSKFKLQNEGLIFLSDGATWIKNWIVDAYPNATHILDFYHVCEYINNFQKLYIKSEKEGQEWVEKQKILLRESKVEEVINNLKKHHEENPKKEAQKIINYLTENQSRMDYLKYSKIGLGIIGSGAIESAHRTLFQKRMKLSGQRWSIKGLQNMIDLKTVNLNKTWNRIIELTKIPKIAA